MLMQTFNSYVCDHLGGTPFAPDFGNPEEQAFAASLDSFTALLRGGVLATGSDDDLIIVPGFIEKMTPGAFADHMDGIHYIAMHQALLVTMMDFALYAFTQSAFLPMIGNAAGEDSPPPMSGEAPGLFLLDRTLAGGTITPDVDRHRVPKDAERHITAVYLAMLMTRFVWLHELAHCRLGHVLRLQQDGHDTRLHEVPERLELVGFRRSSGQGNETRAMRHTMELEADAVALRECIGLQFAGAENLPGIAAMELPLRLALSILGAYIMTWLFEEYQRHMDTLNQMTHPMPRDRLLHLVAVLDAEYARTIDGFNGLHAEIKAQFNILTNALPAMPKI
ncbi:hypothetical protein WG908_03440 [Sphingobium sp. AN641]|uniref:hypothetical protein n=1 Tax=Sphingobium sp. AN641 TaxID=3133443 RepID=UPI0030C572E7